MKKPLFILLLTGLIILSACDGKVEVTYPDITTSGAPTNATTAATTAPPSSPESTTSSAPNDSSTPSSLSPGELFASYGGYLSPSIGDFSSALLSVDDRNPVPSGAKIYKNAYPVTVNGPEYHMGNEFKTMLRDNLTKILKLVNYKFDDPGGFDDTYENQLSYTMGDAYFASNPGNIVIQTMAIALTGNDTVDRVRALLKSDEYLQAAMSYAGIALNNCEIIQQYLYADLEGKTGQQTFTISNRAVAAQNYAYNAAFRSVTIQYYQATTTIHIRRMEPLDEVQHNISYISYQEALQKLADGQGLLYIRNSLVKDLKAPPETVLACEMGYTTYFNPNYFLPCYKFIIDAGTPGTRYINLPKGTLNLAVFFVPAGDYSALE